MLSKPAGGQLSNQETSGTEMDVATHCCSAWSLGTGTIIIGVLNVIGSILQIAVVAYNWDLYQYANDDISGDNSDTKRELVTVLVFGIIQAICSVLLITGAVKEKASMLLSWMVVETLGLLVATVIGIIIGIFLIELRIGSVIIVFVIFFLWHTMALSFCEEDFHIC